MAAADSWTRLSAASRRHSSRFGLLSSALNLQIFQFSSFLHALLFLISSCVYVPAGDVFLGFEDVESGEDEMKAEYPCPFCSDHFDLVGLCCHIDDEHPVELKTGVTPY
jgi:Drought induced 19 protein (Di19), zinc-binding